MIAGYPTRAPPPQPAPAPAPARCLGQLKGASGPGDSRLDRGVP